MTPSPESPGRPAKFQIPHTPDPVSSDRFRGLVELARTHPITLVRAPAGYGKTTILRSIADAAVADGVQVIWCRMDSDDSDPSRFFAGLAGALPHDAALSPDPALLLSDLVAKLAAEHDLLLVMDDVHEISADSTLWPAIDELLRLLPRRAHLAVGTRQELPLRLARLRANGCLAEISAMDLQLSVGEVAGCLAKRKGRAVEDQLSAAVHRRTGGWPACVSLIATVLRETADEEAVRIVETASLPDEVYSFFAEELVDRTPAEELDAMKALSVLDEFDVDVALEICSQDQLDAVMASATRCGVLTSVGDDSRRYRFHPLFRDVLVGQLAKDGEGRSSRARVRAAAALREHGQAPAAVDQLLAAGETREAADLIASIAAEAFARGDVARLAQWLRQIPIALLSAHAALIGLYGQVEFEQGHYQRAAEKLHFAYRLALSDGDELSAAEYALVRVHAACGMGDHVLMEATLADLRGLGLELPPSLEWRAQSLEGMLESMRGRLPESESLLLSGLEAARRAGPAAEFGATVRAGAIWALAARSMEEALRWDEGAERLAAHGDDVVARAIHFSNSSATLANSGRYREAKERISVGVGLAVHRGLFSALSYLDSNLALVAAGEGDLASACAHYDRALSGLASGGARPDWVLIGSELVQVVRARGHTVRALQLARRAVGTAVEIGVVYSLAASRTEELACLVSQHASRSLAGDLAALADECASWGGAGWESQARFHQARCMILLGDEDGAHDALRLCLVASQELSNLHYLIVEAHGDPSTLLFALDADVEAEFAAHILERAEKSVRKTMLSWLAGGDEDKLHRALRLVRTARITDPKIVAAAQKHSSVAVPERGAADPRGAHTRVALRIYTFGGLVVEVDGRRLEKSDWVKMRSREVLRLMVSQPHRAVARDVLTSRFWPDIDEKHAATNAHVAVSHLRRSLEPDLAKQGTSRFIESDHGSYSLARSGVWIDADEYERAVEEGEAALRSDDRTRARELFLAADALYAGDYMADDLYGDAYFAARERYRQMHLKVLEDLADLDDGDGHRKRVPQHLRRMTQLDPWNESTWERLIRAHAELGDLAAAREAYACCCRSIADGDEGAMPSALTELKTELLAKSMRGRGKSSSTATPTSTASRRPGSP